MQGLEGGYSNEVVRLDLACSTDPLAIDGSESAESKIKRLITEHPVVIFSRTSCCMSQVMRSLLANVGVHPAVIELEDHEIACIPRAVSPNEGLPSPSTSPIVFIGGACVGGLESLMALHLSGDLVPKLLEVGAL